MAPGGSQTTVGVTVAANMDVSGILNGVKSMQGAFNGLKLPANLTGDAIKQFDKLKESLTKYRELMEKGPSTKADLKQLEKLEKTIKSSFSDLSKVYDELSGKKIYLEADATAIKNAQKDIDQLKQDVQNKLGSIKFEFSSPTKGKVDIGLNELVSDMERAVKSSKTVSASMREMTNSVKSGNFTDAAKGLTQIEQQATKLKGASVGLLKTFQQMGLIQFNKSAEDLYKSGEHVSLLHQGFEKLRAALSADDAELKRVTKSLSDAVDKKSELEKIGERNYNNNLAKQAQDADQLRQGYDQCAEAARGFAQQSMSAAQQVEQLQQSTQYFFSLRNMINLLKRGIDEAVQSVKELDKAMTETAVVTDYKVSDLWGMLPEYTKVANQLGATTQGAYETMTLYYQQGLEQQQAFELGAETMKMARIAGLDYAETTDMMTAALRGFNMELNETSAKRVNDVYSELAAITASDTEELGTAMQRTASIAASAGASFEGTTAFLAQAIETTREPAENIGTAMKTIVARFQEMKKNPLEISEVDGEEVDYNKIDAALKTIGVDLKDTNGQFRDFDQVMLDISARWDSLSQSQQRYIATVAAGSRQQSRFIAMVSNYERTMQLMEAANNSAGASDEQFGKTMDSLESKLNQLHNAWQQFTMGIANNGMIKMAVDGLTGFLNITNKIIDKLSLGIGPLKSFLSIFAAFTGLKATGRLANQLIGGLGGLVDPTSTFKQGFKGGAIRQGQTGTAQAKAISDPIVTAVNRIYGAITGKQATTNQTAQNTSADFKSFKDANAEMRNFLGSIKANQKFSIAEAYGKISNLDDRQQKAVLQQLPGLQLSLQKNGISFDTTGLNISDEASKLVTAFNNEISQGLKDKTIDTQTAMQIFGTPENLKKAMEARGPEYAKAASEILFDEEYYKQQYEKHWKELSDSDSGFLGHMGSEEELDAREAELKAQAAARAKVDTEAKGLEEYNKRIKGTASAGMQAANDIASVGQAAIMAGQGVAQLGMQLSNAGFTQAGQVVTNLGYQISSLGQIATSVGSVVGKIAGAGGIGVLVAAHPVITALIAAVTLLGGAFAIASVHFKNIKKAGEEVINTFKETSKSAEDNIAKLKAYQSEFAQLSKGVDANGNNVNLDDSQYQRYLEIVDDIAEINPDIVKGYNAQGHAIIDNNTALTETLKLQEQIKDQTYDTYTSEESLQKLINARNINKDYKKTQTQENGVSMGYGHGNEGRNSSNGIGKAIPLAGDVSSIADQLRLLQGTDALGNTIRINDEMLQKYGIESLDALISGEEQAVKNFIKHRDKIQADLTNSGFELGESITKGFDKLGEDAGAFNEAIKPVYDNLLTSVSNSPIFDSIAPEFREALNMGLKDLASQDLSASEMSQAANIMATKFANLATGSGQYQDALDTVTEAQENFATTLDEAQYTADVQPAIDELVRLKEEALDEGGAYGDALAEYLENQIEQIASFTQEGTTTVAEGLNTATDAIAQAESALDNFNEATKKDFSTAAEGMRGIYDKIFETYKDSYGNELEKHTEGEGDNTFWTGAEALLSENKLAGGVNEVTKSLKQLEPWLREGKEGMDAFFTDVINNDKLKQLEKDGLIKLDEQGWFEEIPEGQWENVANTLGISEELLTSMLNKARQFGLIDFDNLNKVREALATGDSAIKGINSNAQGQKALYVKEDTMRQQLRESGYNTKESQDNVIDRLLKEQNVHMVKTMDNLSKKSAENLVKDWGIKDLSDLITKMSETGEYNKEEILDLAEKAGLGSGEEASNLYDNIIQALDNPELAQQTSELQSINAKLDAIIDHETGKGVEDYEKQQKEDHESILGKEGIATNFAKGLNAEGKLLDSGSFAVVRKDLEETQKQYEETANHYKERAKYATEEDKDRFEALAKLYTKDAKAIADAITEGEKTAEKKKKDAEKRKTSDKFKRDEKEGKNNGKEPAPSPAVSSNRPLEQTEKRNIETTEKHHKTEETEKTTKYDSSETTEHKKLQKLWEEDKNNPHLDKDVTVEGDDKGLKDLNKDVNKFDARFNDPFTAHVKANMDEANKGVVDFNAYVQQQNPQVPVGANTQSAKSSISSLYNVSTLFVPIKPDFQGTWEKSITIRGKREDVSKGQNGGHPTQAQGKNNHASIAGLPSFGSAARGYGRLGPKGKGGPTLTGELGYEIAWLPDENRSMILGADGPQMIDLPGNAVVWTHEQSKKILKQKAIPMGSHGGPSANGSSKNYVVTYNTNSGSGNGIGNNNSNNNHRNRGNSVKLTNKIEVTTGKINLWWDNIERKVDKVSKDADKLGDKLTKKLNDVRASISQVNKANEAYINKQKQVIKYNQAEYATARAGLSSDKYKQLSLASKSITKKTSKTEAQRIRNARKELGISQKTAKTRKAAIDNERKVNVSWKAPAKVKSGKNKGKLIADKTVDVNRTIDPRNYIKWDRTTKTYVVNTAKINAGSKFTYKTKDGTTKTAFNKERSEAISKETESYLKNMQSRKDTAEENITKAQDALADYRKQIDDTFFGWKNELTEIYNTTAKIEVLEAKLGKTRSQQTLAQTKLDQEDLSFGMTADALKQLGIIKSATEESIQYYKDEAEAKQKLLDNKVFDAEQADYGKLRNKKVTYEDINGKTKTASEKDIYNRIKKKKNARQGSGQGWDELSEQEKRIYARGRAFDSSYIKKSKNGYALNTKQIEADRKSGKISEELYNLIKDTYDTLHQYDVDKINTEAEVLDLQKSELETRQEYSDLTKQIGDQLYGWKNTLTQILQLTYQIEQSEKRTSYLKSTQDYYNAKQKAGYGVSSAEVLSAFTGQMISTVNQIQQRTDLVAKQRQDLQDYIGGKDIEAQLNHLRGLSQNDATKAKITDLEQQQEIRRLAKNYVKTTNNADGTVSIEFDSAALERDNGVRFDSTVGPKIEEYAQELVNKNNEIAENTGTNLANITELYTQLGDLRQEYADRAKELREAYGAQQQKVIDNVKTLYTAIDNNFKELINNVKQSIQQRRQTEDNAKTEQDISRKQQRLAAMRANTAGGNQVEIAQLQKEINDAQQSYGRTLEDQMIDRISQQGDEAAKQRQQQIDLMQAQRDIAAKTGRDAEEINKWLNKPEEHKAEIESALKDQASWASLTEAEKTVFTASLNTTLTELNTIPEKIKLTEAALTALKGDINKVETNTKEATETAINQASTETIAQFNTALGTTNGKIDVTNSGITEVAGYLDKKLQDKIAAEAKAKADTEAKAKAAGGGNGALRAQAVGQAASTSKTTTSSSKTVDLKTHRNTLAQHAVQVNQASAELDLALKSKDKKRIATARGHLGKAQADAQAYLKSHQGTPEEKYYNVLFDRGNKNDAGGQNWGTIGGVGLNNMFTWGKKLGKSEIDVMQELVDTEALTWEKIIKAYIEAKGKDTAAKNLQIYFGTIPTLNRRVGWEKVFKKPYPQYALGGLAKQTGPAWLDGTPSKPELVLNATDTKNFLALRDVLSKALSSTSSVENSYGGDIMYDININVDKIEKDYDVDRVIERVKKEITKGAGYRNVTQVRNFR